MIGKFEISDEMISRYNVNVALRQASTCNIHMHDFYELEICLAGKAKAVINQTDYEVKKGSIFLLTPSDVHKYTANEDFTLLNLSFTPDSLEYSSFLETLFSMSYIASTIDEETEKRLTKYIYQLKNEAENPKRFSRKYISFLLSCILIELFRLNTNVPFSDKNTEYEKIQKSVYYIRTHFKEPITLKNVSDFAGIPESVISKKIKKSLGTGFKEYLTNQRLDYAKKIIVETDYSITDIAYGSGFNSLSYFQKVFMKKYNTTPRNYRKVNKEH